MRPRDFTPAPHRYLKQLHVLAELLRGATAAQAAARIGHSVKTIYTWRRRNPSFRRAWDRARDYARFPPFPSPAVIEKKIHSDALRLPADDAAPVPRPLSWSAVKSGGKPGAAPRPRDRLTVVIRGISPDIPDRHIEMRRGPDGKMATVAERDVWPAAEDSRPGAAAVPPNGAPAGAKD